MNIFSNLYWRIYCWYHGISSKDVILITFEPNVTGIRGIIKEEGEYIVIREYKIVSLAPENAELLVNNEKRFPPVQIHSGDKISLRFCDCPVTEKVGVGRI